MERRKLAGARLLLRTSWPITKMETALIEEEELSVVVASSNSEVVRAFEFWGCWEHNRKKARAKEVSVMFARQSRCLPLVLAVPIKKSIGSSGCLVLVLDRKEGRTRDAANPWHNSKELKNEKGCDSFS
ncbi:unnamed protein product [Lactuca saligna]|uniref:Uncharacterized protein n=1 Tax=Lactuca saligna TaxID=75948 RepID=A0AA35UZW2_LACSI|nr:unnamed protein product [Lactuca saligna]